MGTDRRPASHQTIRLMLLGPPPDMVHGVSPRRPVRSHIPRSLQPSCHFGCSQNTHFCVRNYYTRFWIKRQALFLHAVFPYKTAPIRITPLPDCDPWPRSELHFSSRLSSTILPMTIKIPANMSSTDNCARLFFWNSGTAPQRCQMAGEKARRDRRAAQRGGWFINPHRSFR